MKTLCMFGSLAWALCCMAVPAEAQPFAPSQPEAPVELEGAADSNKDDNQTSDLWVGAGWWGPQYGGYYGYPNWGCTPRPCCYTYPYGYSNPGYYRPYPGGYWPTTPHYAPGYYPISNPGYGTPAYGTPGYGTPGFGTQPYSQPYYAPISGERDREIRRPAYDELLQPSSPRDRQPATDPWRRDLPAQPGSPFYR